MHFHRRAAAALALALSTGAAWADGMPHRNADGLLVSPAGLTLYTWDNDITPGRSLCTKACAAMWPPLIADAGAQPSAEFDLVLRNDGRKQWAYKGKPLYLWYYDAAPGDMKGEKVNAVWHLAR